MMDETKFDVKVEIDKFTKNPVLCVTHDGSQWTSIRIENPRHEIPQILFVLMEYLRDMKEGE